MACDLHREAMRPSSPSLSVSDLSFARSAPWRDKLSLLLESTGDGMCGIDMEGRCIFANQAAARLLGRDAGAMLGCNMHALMHHTHADGSHYCIDDCPIFRAFWQGQPCRIDTEVLWRADGTSFPAEYSSYPIVEDGVVRGAVVTFVDISDRKRAEALLRQTNADLERRVADRTRELTEALAQLRELSAHAHAVREDERTRIAREIHDGLGSLLVALKLDVDWMARRVTTDPLQHKCRAMGGLIDGAVDEIGRIITDLRPSLLDHQGLLAALEWQFQEFAAATDLACDWHLSVDPDASIDDNDACATAVFRIFQEVLSNIARHARAQCVGVEVRCDAHGLRIVVSDDGVGAAGSAFAAPRAYGVRGMRERARHFGGDVEITSTPGAGTEVSLTMPWTPAAS